MSGFCLKAYGEKTVPLSIASVTQSLATKLPSALVYTFEGRFTVNHAVLHRRRSVRGRCEPPVQPLRPHQRCGILVAEDNEFNTRHLKRLLARHRHQVRPPPAGPAPPRLLRVGQATAIKAGQVNTGTARRSRSAALRAAPRAWVVPSKGRNLP
jgi:hypothetical protein